MRKFKLTINRIWQKEIQTKFGMKGKYSIEFKERPKTYIDSWINQWNQDWKTGDVIEVSEGQLKEREYNGKKYFTIAAPLEAKFNGVSRNEFDILVERVTEIERQLEQRQEEFVPEQEEELEVAVADLPF